MARREVESKSARMDLMLLFKVELGKLQGAPFIKRRVRPDSFSFRGFSSKNEG